AQQLLALLERAAQKGYDLAEERAVFVARNLSGAGRRADSEVMIEAGAFFTDVAREGAVAGGYAERLLNRAEYAVQRRYARIRTEVFRAVGESAPRHCDFWIGVV